LSDGFGRAAGDVLYRNADGVPSAVDAENGGIPQNRVKSFLKKIFPKKRQFLLTLGIVVDKIQSPG
jgi:hypothetical protein